MFQDLKRDNGSGAPTRDAWNKTLDRLESLVISPGPGLFMRRGLNGTVIWTRRERRTPQDLGRFVVTFNAKLQRLYVSEGSVVSTEGEGGMCRGMMPRISDTSLDSDPRPFFDVSSLEAGSYDVVCSFNEDKAEIFVMQGDEVVLGHEGGGEESESEGGVKWLLSSVALEAGENGFTATITPVWLSDIAWRTEESSSEGSSESGDSSDQSSDQSEEPSDGGSSKDTAIVPAPWSRTGFVALYAMESPDVRFEDVMAFDLTGKTTRRKIDRKFVTVCEPDTIVACGFTIDQPVMPGISVKDGWITVRLAQACEPARLTVKLSGIRRGFLKTRFGIKTRAQFEANERRLKGT